MVKKYGVQCVMVKSREEDIVYPSETNWDRVEREYKEYLEEYKYYKSMGIDAPQPLLSKTEFVIKLIDKQIDVVWGRQTDKG